MEGYVLEEDMGEDRIDLVHDFDLFVFLAEGEVLVRICDVPDMSFLLSGDEFFFLFDGNGFLLFF